MKRSEVNRIMADADAFIRSFGFVLPPFAYWEPERMRGPEATEIRARGLGWDITDFAKGNFDEMGLFLFTTRNGRAEDLARGTGMVYAEKIMITRENQLSPMHRHIVKTEDIINRGGGTLIIELFGSNADGSIDRSMGCTVACDGIPRTVEAGGQVRLAPGESVTLVPGDWHAFWAEEGDCLVGEVSTVNDDNTDNIFDPPLGRFSEIEEDVAPTHLLVSDY